MTDKAVRGRPALQKRFARIHHTRFLFRESFGSAHASPRRFREPMRGDDRQRLQIGKHRERQYRQYITHRYLPLTVTNRLARKEIVRVLERKRFW